MRTLICILVALPWMQALSANISSFDYLNSLPKPNFKTPHQLPHITRWSYSINSNTCVEMARNWGYTLELGSESDVDILTQLSNTNSKQSGFVRLANIDPSHYTLMMGLNQRYLTPRPDGVFVTNASGYFVAAYGTNTFQYQTNGTPVLSPEGDDDYWTNAAAYWIGTLGTILTNYSTNIAIVLNGGEYGLPIANGGNMEAWAQDPRVQTAVSLAPWNAGYDFDSTNTPLRTFAWFHYGSYRRAHQYQFTTDAVKYLLPGRELYVHYETDGESYRSLNLYGTNWYTGNHYYGLYTRSMSDYPNFESYFMHFNTGFSGAQDMLTKYLNAVGAHRTYGALTNYTWINGGYYRTGIYTNDFADIPRYMGLLKCYYTAGMVGAIAGYYSTLSDTNFPSGSPPHWLQQVTALAHVHALFTHLENYIYQGDLMVGSGQNHSTSVDQPAYEFTNTVADATVRVLARKLNASDAWLITAWAADGTNRTRTVSIPTLGSVNVLARDCGTVYTATVAGGLTMLDPNGTYPTEFMYNRGGNAKTVRATTLVIP